MTDPLAGMTREEARELVAEARLACERIEGVDMLTADFKKLYALAALGAECVGATEVVLNVSSEADWSLSPKLPNERLEPWERRVLVLKEDK